MNSLMRGLQAFRALVVQGFKWIEEFHTVEFIVGVLRHPHEAVLIQMMLLPSVRPLAAVAGAVVLLIAVNRWNGADEISPAVVVESKAQAVEREEREPAVTHRRRSRVHYQIDRTPERTTERFEFECTEEEESTHR